MALEIIFSVFLTSLLSGVFGMAGGMILMGHFSLIMAVEAAMILHGITQLWSNGFRAFLLRRHIVWSVFWPYISASLITVALLRLISFVPNKAVVYLLLGAFPFVGLFSQLGKHLSIQKKLNSYLCGVLVSMAQISAGASGAILDLFFIESSLNRHEIIATKAFTQTIGHALKLLYYFTFINLTTAYTDLHLNLVPILILMASLGTYCGKSLLENLSESTFRNWSKKLILTIGVTLFLKGLSLLF